MKCKDCEYFHIIQEPLRGTGGLFDCGRAKCDKYNLCIDFTNHRKLSNLVCVLDDTKRDSLIKDTDNSKTITNGDMIKLLWNIKNIDEKTATVFCDVGKLGLLSISLEWWNAPFRKVDEDE